MSDNRYDKRDVSGEASSRSARQEGRTDDPLAELARLIDEDPFADFERRRTQPAETRYENEPRYEAEAGGDAHRQPDEDYREAHAEPEQPPAMNRPAPLPAPEPEAPQVIRRFEAPRREFDAASALERELSAPSAREIEEPAAAEEPPAAWPETYYAEPPAHGEAAEPDYEARYAPAAAEEDYRYGEHEAAYADGGYAPPEEYGYGYEERPGRSRKGLLIATVLGGVLLLGGAGAYAYRTFVGDPAGSPPVIRADTSPVKIEPAEEQTASTEDPAGKLVYDRVGGRASAGEERLVSREEPVFAVEGRDRDVRVIETGTENIDLRGGDTGEDAVSNAPRRVRTVVVRPDGTIVAPSESEASEPAEAATAAVPAAPSIENSESPVIGDGAASAEAAPEPEAPQQPQQVETAAVPAQESAPAAESQQANRNDGAPMQLVPDAARSAPQPQSQPQPQQQTETQVAAAAAPAPRVGAFPAGSFVVQVASARSEDEARATAQAVRERYGNMIASYQPAIERADLGERGIFYRVGLGPVETQSDADMLCEQLKSAGLDCFVRRN